MYEVWQSQCAGIRGHRVRDVAGTMCGDKEDTRYGLLQSQCEGSRRAGVQGDT